MSEHIVESDAPPCLDCGPGYRIGAEGCRHSDSYQPEFGETGICRTCAQPIWWEEGEIGGRKVVGWSDRITRGGDSVVCFKAVGYRHVPMGGREAAIYEAGRNSVTAEPHPVTTHIEWAVQTRSYPLGVGIRLYGDDEAGARAAAPKVIGAGADVLCRTVVEYAPSVSEWRVIPPGEGRADANEVAG